MRKHSFFKSNLGMWALKIDHLRKMRPVLRVSTQIYGVSKKIDGKMFIFIVNLGMWSCKSIIFKNELCSEGFNTLLWGFQEDIWENVHLSIKPRHVTLQINHLRKTIPLPRVSTHIYGVSRKIDGEMFIFRVNLGKWPLKSMVWEKWSLFWGFQHTFLVFLRR